MSISTTGEAHFSSLSISLHTILTVSKARAIAAERRGKKLPPMKFVLDVEMGNQSNIRLDGSSNLARFLPLVYLAKWIDIEAVEV